MGGNLVYSIGWLYAKWWQVRKQWVYWWAWGTFRYYGGQPIGDAIVDRDQSWGDTNDNWGIEIQSWGYAKDNRGVEI